MDTNIQKNDPSSHPYAEQEEKAAIRQGEDTSYERLLKRKKIKQVLIGLAVLAIVAWFVMSSAGWSRKSADFKSREAGITEVAGTFFKSQGQDHIQLGFKHPAYSSSPPTSGWHLAIPAKSGIYGEEQIDEQIVHNLEHGHIWISYRPDLDPAVVKKLVAIAKGVGSKMVVSPRKENDIPIALAAWEYLLKLDSFDEAQILGFIKAHLGKGPENVPDAGF